MITKELYIMARDFLSWYDDVVTFGYGKYLTQNDIKTAKVAEEVIKLWQKEL